MAKKEAAPVGGARKAVPRATKIERKLGGITAKTSFDLKTAQFSVVGFVNQPTEIPGFIIEQNDSHVLFRHRATSASKKMKVSVFKKSEVLELFGSVGQTSSITVLQRRQFTSAIGRLKLNSDGSVTVTTAAKETVNFPSNERVSYEISAHDESDAGARKPKASAEAPAKAKKAGKVVKLKTK